MLGRNAVMDRNRTGVCMFRLAYAFCVVFSAQTIGSTVALGQGALERDLRSALASLPHAETRFGACVVDLTSGDTVFAQQADHPLTPASSMKLFTMVVALDVLGPDFEFRTVLATDGTNIFVIGDGDPAFGDQKLLEARGESISSDFERWADALGMLGMTTIPGDLVIDESVFDHQLVHPSWEESDLDNWYAAPVGALNFNDNCIDITISPVKRTGAPVRVSFQPENDLVEIVNKCRSGGKGKPVLRHHHSSFVYELSGGCQKRWPFGPVSFPDPGLLLADSLKKVLLRKGVLLEGTIRRERVRRANGRLPRELTIVAEKTTSLADVLRRVGKDSQNLFAECVFKRAGFRWEQQHGAIDPWGSWASGEEAVMQIAGRAGLDTASLRVADGSGLSRKNACTARHLATILAWAQRRPFGAILLANLSIAGVDGSLRKRMVGVAGRIRGKTGTMRGVTALAGYVDGANGAARYAFAIIFNGYSGPSRPYKAIQDRFCSVLSRGNGATKPSR